MSNNWIKIEDREPRHGQRVLVVFNRRLRGCKRQIRTARFYAADGRWFVHGDSGDCGYYDMPNVESWMELPEMPQGLT